VADLFISIDDFESQRVFIWDEFSQKVLKDSHFLKKSIRKEEAFFLLELNSLIKRLIRELMA